jgi:hypothetical protein
MLAEVKSALRSATCTDYSFMVRNVTTRIMEDNTTTTPLMHGIVEATVYFSPKH